MPANPKPPTAAKPKSAPVAEASTTSDNAPRQDAPAVSEAQGASVLESLQDGARVRVALKTSWPLYCHPQTLRLLPGQEHSMVVDKWVRSNVLRGNLDIVPY